MSTSTVSAINDSFGVVERKGVPVTSSRKVADVFNKQHGHVIRDIEDIKANLSKIGEVEFNKNFLNSSYVDSKKRKYPEYLMTRDGFTLLAMGFGGKKAMQFKVAYINCFNQMETFIQSLSEAKAEFPEFTDAILAAHEEPKHYHFSNECNMINSIVLGMTAKKFREANDISKGKSIRPYLQPWQIEAVRSLQRMDIGLILAVPDCQERKAILIKHFHRSQQKLLSA